MTAYYSRELEREQERTVILEKLHFSWELLLKPFIFAVVGRTTGLTTQTVELTQLIFKRIFYYVFKAYGSISGSHVREKSEENLGYGNHEFLSKLTKFPDRRC